MHVYTYPCTYVYAYIFCNFISIMRINSEKCITKRFTWIDSIGYILTNLNSLHFCISMLHGIAYCLQAARLYSIVLYWDGCFLFPNCSLSISMPLKNLVLHMKENKYVCLRHTYMA